MKYAISLITLIVFCIPSLLAQQTFTFTNCGASGRLGPSQSQVNSTYSSGNNLQNKVTIRTRGIQEWVVPTSGPYRIDVRGAEGGRDIYTTGNRGGRGARMVGEFNLTAGQTIKVVVGQKGGDTRFGNIDNAGAGGGGGSYVWINTGSQLLVAAGGGGGASSNTGTYSGINANAGINGNNAQGISSTGGQNGNGGRRNTGGASYWAGGGSGWLTDGTGGNNPTNYNFGGGSRGAQGGQRPLNGAEGGVRWNDGRDEGGDGGFGGGGGGGSDNMGAGGGGGYSGGGGARGGSYGDGGGGGSYNAGSNKSNSAAWNRGHGQVIITSLFGVDVTQTDSIDCFGDSTASIFAQVSGGTPPYRFVWNTGDTTFSGQTISGYTLLGHRGTHSYYRRNSQTSSYTVASDEAQTYYGYLASITSASENSWLWSNGAQSGNYIGLTDKDSEGTFVWDSGESFSYSNWGAGEPNNSGNEDFVQFISSGRWNDISWSSGTNRRPLIELPGVSILEDLAAGTYTVTVTDNGGNSVNTSFTVAQPADITLTPTATDVACFGQSNGSINTNVSGGVGPFTYAWSNGSSTKDLTGLSAGNFVLTVTDDNSCTDSVTVNVSEPGLVVPSISLISGESCNGQSDGSLQVDSTYNQYNWSNGQTSRTASSLGAGSYRVTVTNSDGCKGTASDTVPLNDTLAPSIVSLNSTLYLNTSGTLTIVASDVATITDNCSISSSSLSKQNFSCADTGSNTITVRATDNNGLTDSLQVNFTVLDTIKPVARAKTVNAYLDGAGQVTVSTSMVDNGSSDNCSLGSKILSKQSFNCSDVGSNTIWFSVTDYSGNVDSSRVSINVIDTVRPNVLARNLTVYLDSVGTAQITSSQVDNGSSDNCSLASLSLSKNAFNCSDTGLNQIRLTAQDINGNTAFTVLSITVIDTIKPSANAKAITVYLDATGSASITSSDVDSNSSDNCSISTFGISKSSFSCSDTGRSTESFWVIDASSNTDTAQFTITVLDTNKPVARAKTINVYLDSSGQFTVNTSMVNNGSSDNCGISAISLDQSTFTCADLGGSSTILRVTDNSGNTDSTTFGINVLDTIKPNIEVKSIFAYLTDSGTVVVKPSDVDSATSDNCSIVSYQLSPSSFTCVDTGVHRSIFSAVDNSGNIASDTVLITIIDTIKPHLQARNNVEIYLDSLGAGQLILSDVDSSSFDNCGIDTLFISPASFDCGQIGRTNTYLIGSDQNGNTDSLSVNVEVIDTISPKIICPKDLIICEGILTYDDPQVTDNCLVYVNNVSGPMKGDNLSAGNYSITFAATDQSANLNECSMAVKVNPLPQISLGSDTALGLNAVLSLNAGHPDKNILWSTGDTTDSISVVIKLDTLFSVQVKDSNMCVGVDTIRVSFITASSEKPVESIRVFPNPSSGHISLVNPIHSDVLFLRVIDMTGRKVRSAQIIDQETKIDLNHLTPGTYFLELSNQKGRRLYDQKLIITK